MPTASLSEIVSEPQAPPRTASVEDIQPSATPQDHHILPAIATASGIALPIVKKALEEIATNPNVPQMAAKVGRVIGGLTPPIAGAAEGGPVGLLAGIAAASKGAWAGGRTGWFTGKLLQNVAVPFARVAAALEPYAPALAMLAQEGDTLGRLNSVESVVKLASSLHPDQQHKILEAYEKQPEYADAIRAAIVDSAVKAGQKPLDAAFKVSKTTAQLNALMQPYLKQAGR